LRYIIVLEIFTFLQIIELVLKLPTYYSTVVLTLNPTALENGIIFSLPQAVPAGQIKSFAIPQQKETIN
jgi:hypothetical protein